MKRVTLLALAFVVGGLTGAEQIITAVPVKATSREQLAYVRAVVHAIPAQPGADARKKSALHGIAAARVVSTKWPEDTRANIEAHFIAGQIYENERMLQNALDEFAAAEVLAAKSELHARVLAAQASVYRRLRRFEEAAEAFAAAERDSGFRLLNEVEQVGVFSEAADAEAKANRPKAASAHLRRAASIRGVGGVVRLTLLLRSLEVNERAGLGAEAAADADQLDTLLLEIRKQHLGAGDTAAVDQIETLVRGRKRVTP